jgi:predicted transposase YbfD/YdcC
LRRLEGIVTTTKPTEVNDSRDLARNRQEDRRVEVFAPAAALDGGDWGPLVAAVVRVTRETSIRSAATGLWKCREETALYVSSIMLPAETFASAIRNHWAIENKNHWVRDVTLAEDASRIRINPGVMARLRSQALNIVRANGVENIAEARWSAALDPAISLSYRGMQRALNSPDRRGGAASAASRLWSLAWRQGLRRKFSPKTDQKLRRVAEYSAQG